MSIDSSNEAPRAPAVFDAPPAALDTPSYAGAGVARGALLGLAICALIDGAEIVLRGIGIVRWSMGQDTHFDEYGQWLPPTWILDFETLLGGASLIALIATGITFLIWFSRAYASARATILGGPVIAWFIPFASRWLPYLRVRDVWKVLTGRPIGFVQVWWGLSLGNTFFLCAPSYQPETREEVPQLHAVMIGANVVDIITALLTARIVMTIDQAAHTRMPATF